MSRASDAFLHDLLQRWEAELRVLRACGATEAAATRETDIRDLRAWWTEFQLKELTLEEAAEYSGLCSDTVRHRVSSGKIPNAGEKGRPRVRRCDLPMKPAGPPLDPEDVGSIAGRIPAARRRP
jgi:hypothetical protein